MSLQPIIPARKQSIAKVAANAVFQLLPRSTRIRLGRFILNQSLSDNNDDQLTNGELYVIRCIQHRLRGQSAVVLDVGANVGDWSRLLCHDSPAPLRIYAFEPCRSTFEQLSRNIAACSTLEHAAARAIPVHSAMGRAPGKAALNVAGSLAGTQSLVLRDSGAIDVTAVEEITVTCGDQFCADHGLDEVAFVKIDTEGFEMEVLHGFARMLSAQKIGCIQFEYGGTWIDARILLKDAFALLEPLGYRLAKIHPRGIERFDRYDVRCETFQYSNYLAMRSDWTGVFDTIPSA